MCVQLMRVGTTNRDNMGVGLDPVHGSAGQ